MTFQTRRLVSRSSILWIALLLAGLALAGCAAQEPAQDQTAATFEEPEITIDAADAVVTTDQGTEVTLYVTKDGFVPANVVVPAGKPVTLMVTRKTDRTCATGLVMKEKDINQELPLDETVSITFTPDHAGTLEYACPMDMIKGSITVQ